MVAKKYFLVTLMMTTNVFVVNDLNAMNETEDSKEGKEEQIDEKWKDTIENSKPYKCLNFLLPRKNRINLLGGILFHLSNLRYNFYENKPSFYFDIWCGGWNSKPFAKGHLQICPNINFARGILWLIIYLAQRFLTKYSSWGKKKGKEINVIEKKTGEGEIMLHDYSLSNKYEYTPICIATFLQELTNQKLTNKNKSLKEYSFIFIKLLQDLGSLPLLIHFTSKFSIPIAIDSIIWIGVSSLCHKYVIRMHKED